TMVVLAANAAGADQGRTQLPIHVYLWRDWGNDSRVLGQVTGLPSDVLSQVNLLVWVQRDKGNIQELYSTVTPDGHFTVKLPPDSGDIVQVRVSLRDTRGNVLAGAEMDWRVGVSENALEVTGPDTCSEGQEIELKAFFHKPDGTVEEVTQDCSWEIEGGGSVIAPGHVRVESGSGHLLVTVRYSGVEFIKSIERIKTRPLRNEYTASEPNYLFSPNTFLHTGPTTICSGETLKVNISKPDPRCEVQIKFPVRGVYNSAAGIFTPQEPGEGWVIATLKTPDGFVMIDATRIEVLDSSGGFVDTEEPIFDEQGSLVGWKSKSLTSPPLFSWWFGSATTATPGWNVQMRVSGPRDSQQVSFRVRYGKITWREQTAGSGDFILTYEAPLSENIKKDWITPWYKGVPAAESYAIDIAVSEKGRIVILNSRSRLMKTRTAVLCTACQKIIPPMPSFW
ncbi:MAG: hypothetical protein ACPLRU_03585, partial [Desulfofundulus sp.]